MLTPPAQPPTGFQGVLTRDRWRGVIDFASAINAKIVSSFVISDGVRDESGQWSPEQAQRWLEFTPVGGARDLIALHANRSDMLDTPRACPRRGAWRERLASVLSVGLVSVCCLIQMCCGRGGIVGRGLLWMVPVACWW